jgi:glycosyltransferase involved in cell wall biosynthesis
MQGFLANKIGVRFFKHFFWLYSPAMMTLKVGGYDNVIVSSSFPAKNIRLGNNRRIVHYCHSPSRFLHNMNRETDMKTVNPVLRFFVPFFTFWLKRLDVAGARNLTKKGAVWVVNATHMKSVIKAAYGVEDSRVIYPPVDIKHFSSLAKHKQSEEEEYYMSISRISFHKKVEVLIEACAILGKRLYISGSAAYQAETDKLNELIKELDTKYAGTSERIKLLGRLPDDQRDEYLSGTKALLFAGREDFGITMIEVLASGTPLVMYKAGGALDYLVDEVNGVFADDQSPESFVRAIQHFESCNFDENQVRQSAQRFGTESFCSQIDVLLEGAN